MFYKEFKGVAYEAQRLMEQDLMNLAKKELGLSEEELVIRDLRPEDIIISGTPQWSKTANATGGWATGGAGWKNLTNTFIVADNRFIGIYGVSDRSTNVTQLKIERSGSVTRYWHIQELVPNSENNVMFVDDPVIIPQNNLLTIKGYSLASATEYIRLLGLVVERKGLLVSP